MLLIRAAQMQVFQQQRNARRLHELADYLRTSVPALVEGWDDASLQGELQAAQQSAARYGIGDALALAEYFAAMRLYGPRFDLHPAIAAILGDGRMAPDHRIFAVWAHTSAATWDEVANGAAC